jgi:hypothetical protein
MAWCDMLPRIMTVSDQVYGADNGATLNFYSQRQAEPRTQLRW